MRRRKKKKNKNQKCLPYVEVKNNHYERAISEFKKRVKNSGMLLELRNREFYEKPSAEKRRKKKRWTDGIAKVKISKDKCPINIDLFGNVSSASIPLLMVTNLKEKLITGANDIACIGFGVGLSWSGMSFNSSEIEYINMLEKDL